MPECPGSCNSRYRKARALYQAELTQYHALLLKVEDPAMAGDPPKPPDIQPWQGEPVWCPRCQAAIRRQLAELDDLAAMVAALPPGIRPAVSGTREHVKVSGSREQASPSGTTDDLDEFASWLRSWESAYRDTDPLARRGWLATEITTGVSQLLFHFDAMIANGDYARDYGDEVKGWHRGLTARAHAASASKHVKKPCPRCSQYTLWEDLGADYIRCVNEDCNRRLTRSELEAGTEVALAST